MATKVEVIASHPPKYFAQASKGSDDSEHEVSGEGSNVPTDDDYDPALFQGVQEPAALAAFRKRMLDDPEYALHAVKKESARRRRHVQRKSVDAGSPLFSVRSIPCFHANCTYSYKRPGSNIVEVSDRPVILPAKFDGYTIRSCKKHHDHWRALESVNCCEVCRGLNNAEAGFQSPRTYVNDRNMKFLLCLYRAEKQATMLAIKVDWLPSDEGVDLPTAEPDTAEKTPEIEEEPEESNDHVVHTNHFETSGTTEATESAAPAALPTFDMSGWFSSADKLNQDMADRRRKRRGLLYAIPGAPLSPGRSLNSTHSLPDLSILRGIAAISAPPSPVLSVPSNTITSMPAPMALPLFTSHSSNVSVDQSHHEAAAQQLPVAEKKDIQSNVRASLSVRIAGDTFAVYAGTRISAGTVLGAFTMNDISPNEPQELRFVADAITLGQAPNSKMEQLDGQVIVTAIADLKENEKVLANFPEGSGFQQMLTNQKALRYLEVFKKIDIFNQGTLSPEECSSAAFAWFLAEGYKQLKERMKITIPIDNRHPHKKGIASQLGVTRSLSSIKHQVFYAWLAEWGYVAQLEALDMERAREDCWVTFKAGKEWNTEAFERALVARRNGPTPVAHPETGIILSLLPEGPKITFNPSVTSNNNSMEEIRPPFNVPLTRSEKRGAMSAGHSSAPSPAVSPVPKRLKSLRSHDNTITKPLFKIEADAELDSLLVSSRPSASAQPTYVFNKPAAEPRNPMEAIQYTDITMKLESPIARGTHGFIYKGLWKGSPVAVRFPTLKSPVTDEERERWINECNQLTLTHPNVITTYGMCANVQLCCVMEWASAGNLKQFLMNASPSTRSQCLPKIALDTARGMEYLHSRGITHCRLKASNVLLKGEISGNNVSNLEVKVGPYTPPADEVELLSSGQRTLPRHIAPEIAYTKEFSPKCDVYSFGMLLCHLFSDGAADPKTPQELSALRSFKGVDQKWKDLISACLGSDPNKRPTFTQVLSSLTEMQQTPMNVEGDKLVAQQPTPMEC